MNTAVNLNVVHESEAQRQHARVKIPGKIRYIARGERFEASRADFQVDVVPDLPPLYGDEDALVTVLLNLLENAHNYTRADKRIALHAYREADRVVFVTAGLPMNLK